MSLMTMQEYGEIHGVSKPAVTKWKQRGWLAFKGKMVDVEASNKNLKKYRQARPVVNSQVNRPVNQDAQVLDNIIVKVNDGETPAQAAERIMVDVDITMDLEEARRVKESYLALLNQLEYDTKSGLVVMADAVLKEVGEEYAKVRTRILSIPSEQAPRIHRLKTVTEVQDALHELLSEALEELTKDEI